MWNYTPQTLTEGWLRFNPTVLAFTLINAAGKPVVQGGSTQTLTLRMANRKPAGITLKPGVLAPEGTPAQGAILYVHFGALVAPADVPAITLSADGWSFAQQSDAVYGTYFAATPLGGAVALDPGASVDIAVGGLKAASDVVEAHVFVDYYAIEGISDGVFVDTVTVQQPSKPK
jgi:hypothetical protein